MTSPSPHINLKSIYCQVIKCNISLLLHYFGRLHHKGQEAACCIHRGRRYLWNSKLRRIFTHLVGIFYDFWFGFMLGRNTTLAYRLEATIMYDFHQAKKPVFIYIIPPIKTASRIVKETNFFLSEPTAYISFNREFKIFVV